MSERAPVFALLTDFGLADPYVGQMKAALAARAPRSPIIDVSHDAPPFCIATGAFFLAASRPFFPEKTIFLCVVDPGVGSGRSLLCVAGEKHTLLGPDNGLLALAWRDMAQEGPVAARRVLIPDKDIANTFHGRDVLAPAAAALARGASPADLGPEIAPGPPAPEWAEARTSVGSALCGVLHVDRFGNCILNLPSLQHGLLPPSLRLSCGSGAERAVLAVSHYAALPEQALGVVPGSQGFCEIAGNRFSAAEELGLCAGQTCALQWGES